MTERVELFLPHRFSPGDPDAPVLLLLHGTGGDENDLLPLGSLLDPAAGVLSPRGPVRENGAARWFRRLAEGVFDHADVIRRAHQLADFVLAARRAYDLGDRSIVAVGFSNGANIAAAPVLLRPQVVHDAILFAAMSPLADPPDVDLSAARVFLSMGENDPMAPLESANRLVAILRERRADVTVHRHPRGHGIAADDVAAARSRLRSWRGRPESHAPPPGGESAG